MAEAVRKEVVGETEHSPIGASSADRWMACPASIRLAKALGLVSKAGFAAAEGTAAHHMAEVCLNEELDAWEVIGTEIDVSGDKFIMDTGMADAVQVYLNFVQDIKEKYPDAEFFYEAPLKSELHPDAYGTADLLAIVRSQSLIIIGDYKHGRGVVCEPDKAQTKIYGYMSLENYIDEWEREDYKVELWIAQPRIPHKKGRVRRHVTTGVQLVNWFTEEVVPAMHETENPESNFEMGDHCRFCPVKGPNCPAATSAIKDVDLSVEPECLNGEEIGDLMKLAAAIKGYVEELEKEAFKRAMGGEHVPGYKLVKKKANRAFKDIMERFKLDDDGNIMTDENGDEVKITVEFEKEVIKLFGDEAYQPAKLKTPPNIEKLTGGKKFISQWAYTPDTGLTLAPNSDRRKEAKPVMEEFLDKLDDL